VGFLAQIIMKEIVAESVKETMLEGPATMLGTSPSGVDDYKNMPEGEELSKVIHCKFKKMREFRDK